MATVMPPVRPADDFSGCRTLIVDPFLATRRLLCDMVRTLGVGAADACAAHQAAAMLDAGPWNVVFVDWSTANDAAAFLAGLRDGANRHRFLPVVVVSSWPDVDHVCYARDTGATEYMLKPFSLEVVMSRLRSIVQAPRLFVEAAPFFGPDRRRRRVAVASEHRTHHNWRNADRRRLAVAWPGPERRQSRPGFHTAERRASRRT